MNRTNDLIDMVKFPHARYEEPVDVYHNQTPLTLYTDLWQVPFGSVQARADWAALQPQSKLLYQQR